MIRFRGSRGLILVPIALLIVSAAACASDKPDPTPTPSGPISFPYIFDGTFTVAGEPGPQGVPIFARLGNGRGPFNNSIRPGEYINVSVAPTSTEDVGREITFHLGHPDGPNVQAEETYIFSASLEPKFVSLDLSFPSLP